jgi:DNA polymerase-3 subunit alpha
MPPDINNSGVVCSVLYNDSDTGGGKNSAGENSVAGKIVFGLMGIKGLGEAAAQEIIAVREAGAYKSFIDFLERVDLRNVNKHALEVLIKTGCFDALDVSRSVLLANLEKAVEHAMRKKSDAETGQASLFGDEPAAEVAFAEFVFEDAPAWTLAEKLEIEKELVGCYISGHPLDAWRTAIARSASITTAHAAAAASQAMLAKRPASGGKQTWQEIQETRANAPRQTIIGIVKAIREITTKKGDYMAFATLEDIQGTLDLVFFPEAWKLLRAVLHNDTIAALYGVLDAKDDKIALQVEKMLDINNLPEKSFREVHIRLDEHRLTCLSLPDEKQKLIGLRDCLLDRSGNCKVFIHVPSHESSAMLDGEAETVVRAGSQLWTVSSTENITAIENNYLVAEVWRV